MPSQEDMERWAEECFPILPESDAQRAERIKREHEVQEAMRKLLSAQRECHGFGPPEPTTCPHCGGILDA